MENKKKYIQIGTGGFGEYWCKHVYPKLSSIAEPVAAADICAAALSNAVEYLGLEPECCYVDVRRAMKEHKADFAVIVVPPQFHEEMIDLALENGMDMVCEKPLADTMEACCRIYRKVKAAGRKLTVTMSHRFEVEKQTVEALVRSGNYGKPNYIVSRLTMQRPDARVGKSKEPESLFSGAMIHNFDTVRGVCGCNAKTVYADGWNFIAEDAGRGEGISGLAQVIMENGVRASFEESFANATTMNKWSEEYLRVECAEATVIADKGEVSIHNHRGYPYPLIAQMPLVKQDYWDHALIVRQFIRWLDGGDMPPTCLEDNIQCCALVYAAVESLRTQKVVNVQEFFSEHMK